MVKSLLAGSLFVGAVAVTALLMQNPSLFQTVTLIVGIVSFIGSGLLSGAFVSGDRIRANLATEEDTDRRSRQSWSGKLFMFGLPFFLAALASFRFL